MDKDILQILFTPTILISRMCLSELIWMPPPERLFIQKVCASGSVGRATCVNTHPPATGCRSPLAGQRRANCDQGVLARRTAGRSAPVVGLVPMSDGVGRQN